MSEGEKKEEGQITHKIEVSTSEKEKELGKEKDTLLAEKAKLEAELARVKTEYTTKVDDLKKATEDLDMTAKERDDLAQKFTTLAMKRFDEEKKVLLDRTKEVIKDDAKIKEIEEKVKSPEELERWRWSLTQLLTGLEASKTTSKPPETTSATPENKGSGGTGNVPLESGEGTVEGDLKKMKFNTPKEMIDYLYDRALRGKTVMKEVKQPDGSIKTVVERVGRDEEAEKYIDQIWKKLVESDAAERRIQATYVLCLQCKGMYDRTLGTCPVCGIPLATGPESDKYGIRRRS